MSTKQHSIRMLSCLLVVLVTTQGCRSSQDSETTAQSGKTAKKSSVPKPSTSPIRFVDVTDQTRIEFVPTTGTTDQKHFPSANGTGVAVLDMDQDGLLDLYFASACRLDQENAGVPNSMYRGVGPMSYQSISVQSGTQVSGFTQGVSVADCDNDGFPDLYLLRFGENILFLNNGDGTFHEASRDCGLNDGQWSTSAAWLDYDNDGYLDVYVANYGEWNLKWHEDRYCGQPDRNIRQYCSPRILSPAIHKLFRSNGDGTYTDVLPDLGLAREDGRGQGVVTCDLNNDGLVDIYVANDLSPNFLFINRGGGKFEDYSDLSGAAFNSDGLEEAGMGVDAGDVNGDGLPELFVTNFHGEHNTMYNNQGEFFFQDVSDWWGLGSNSIQFVGWGTALEDFDGDGWLDIFVANGHVDDNLAMLGRSSELYEQLPALWRNKGDGKFEFLEDGVGDYFSERHVGRGVGFGDLNNDGSIDIVVSHKDERPTILQNVSADQNDHNWIQIKLIGRRSSRDAQGARIEVQTPSQTYVRHLRGGKSYLSAHDLRLTVGLGESEEVTQLRVYWPVGEMSEFDSLQVNKSYVVRESRSDDESAVVEEVR